MPCKPPFATTGLRRAAPALVLATALATPIAHAQPTGGEGFDAASPVVAVVKVAKPWYAPTTVVVSRMRETVPQYDAIPGLAFKAFSLAQADSRYGGIYLWKDLAAARAFYAPAWFERVQRERGVPGQVQFYEAPVVLDNAPDGLTPRDLDSTAVGTVVTVAVPPGVTRARLVQEFQAAVPTYRQIPGLLRKAFILTSDGKFGGAYLWKDAASAQQWFSPAWQDRVRSTYGSAATVEWFDTPILLPSRLAENRVPAAAGPVAATTATPAAR